MGRLVVGGAGRWVTPPTPPHSRLALYLVPLTPFLLCPRTRDTHKCIVSSCRMSRFSKSGILVSTFSLFLSLHCYLQVRDEVNAFTSFLFFSFRHSGNIRQPERDTSIRRKTGHAHQALSKSHCQSRCVRTQCVRSK